MDESLTGIKPPLRILALVTDAFGGIGGLAQFNRDFLEALLKANRQSSVLVLPRSPAGVISHLPGGIVQECGIKNKLFYSLNIFKTVLFSRPFDLIFCGHLYMAPLAAMISHIFKIPFWLQLHGIEAWGRPSCLMRWAAEQAFLVTAVSRYTRRRFLGWANLPSECVRVLPDTYDPRFTPGPKPADLFSRLGLTGKKVLLTVGRLSSSERYKGQDQVINFLPEIIKKIPGLVYLIVGNGDDRPRLEALAKEKGLVQHVLFVGEVSAEDLPMYYRLADLFVMPSTGEGFGIVFLEAMASGVHSLGLDLAGSSDPLQDGNLGHFVDRETLCRDLWQALNSIQVSGVTLSQKIEHFFGKTNFNKQVSNLSKPFLLS